jgi:pilus assembly protein Flp/PilA
MVMSLAHMVLATVSPRVHREDGQTFVEYALLIAFIAIVALVAVQLLGTNVSSIFNQVANSI